MEDETCYLHSLACLAKSRVGILYDMSETKYSEDWTAEYVPAALTTRWVLHGFFFFPRLVSEFRLRS